MMRPRVLLADDHRVVAEGLVRLLGDHAEVVDAVSDARRVVDAVRRLRPDVLIVDISMPYVSGLDVLTRLRRQRLDVRSIVLTMHADPGIAVEALEAGASAFVLKESGGDELLKALDAVMAGRTYLSAELTREIVTRMVAAAEPNGVALSARQRDVLRLIAKGMRAKEIAAALEVPTRTVEALKYRLMQHLNVHSTAELVRYAIEHRLTVP